MPEATNSDLFLSRKLTADESQTLTGKLRPLLVSHADEEEEDINDLLEYTIAMVNNHKTVSYIVEELKGMEMDFCPPDACQRIGDVVAQHMSVLEKGAGSSSSGGNTTKTAEDRKDEKPAKLANALTMAGALSTSRERKPKKTTAALDTPLQASRDKSKQRGENNNDSTLQDSRGNRGKKQEERAPDNRRDARGGRGRTDGGDRRQEDRRDIRGRAFDRLTGGRDNRRTNQGGGRRADLDDGRGSQRDGRGEDGTRRPLGGRRDGSRGGRDGSRGGRDGGQRGGRDDGPRGGRGRDFRGGRGHDDGRDSHRARMDSSFAHRGGRSDRMSGNRRNREDYVDSPDFVPAVRGREDDRNQGRPFEGNKRMRTDEHDGGEQGDYYFRGQGPRGPPGRARFPRGGRFGGRAPFHGQSEEAYQNPAGVEDATDQAAVAHPSPIVAASYRGRGSSYRGRGRGRYSYYPGRADVQSMLAAKTWVRKKDGEGGDGDGDADGTDAAA